MGTKYKIKVKQTMYRMKLIVRFVTKPFLKRNIFVVRQNS